MLQVGDSHEGLVKVVQLQNTGQQEKARYENTAEKFRQSKCLQTNRFQPVGRRWRGYVESQRALFWPGSSAGTVQSTQYRAQM